MTNKAQVHIHDPGTEAQVVVECDWYECVCGVCVVCVWCVCGVCVWCVCVCGVCVVCVCGVCVVCVWCVCVVCVLCVCVWCVCVCVCVCVVCVWCVCVEEMKRPHPVSKLPQVKLNLHFAACRFELLKNCLPENLVYWKRNPWSEEPDDVALHSVVRH
jgi:hypothetical protein